jgi:hypothetical protein
MITVSDWALAEKLFLVKAPGEAFYAETPIV